MRYRTFLIAATVVALALTTWAGVEAGARGRVAPKAPRMGRPSAAHLARVAPAGTLGVLYSQFDNSSGYVVGSQNFEIDFSLFDAQLADDFTVPSGQTWQVTEVDVGGVESVPVPEVIVTIYSDSAGAPGAIVSLRTTRRVTDLGGNLVIKVPPVSIGTGTYWVSVYAQMDFTTHGQWYWLNRSVQSGSESKWRNPGDAFGGTGCTDWSDLSGCNPLAGPDLVFSIRGHLAA